jgi:hypothetical protein
MHEVLGGQIFTPCFYPKHFWEQINGEIWILSHISVPMHRYKPLFGREMAQIQPPTHTAAPTPFFLVQNRELHPVRARHLLSKLWVCPEGQFRATQRKM